MEHRYYIGFRLPDAISKDLQAVQQEFFDSQYMREPLEPHITLLPPPAVERIVPEELVRQVRATSMPFWPLSLTLAQVVDFKNRAIAIQVDGQPIYDLQKRLIALLPPETEVSYYPNPQFSPHVTLAQAQYRKQIPAQRVHDYEERLQSVLPKTFDVDELTIFKWIAPRRYSAHSI
ncbi:MAG TPA: 2'-5' RNA ligase family protein [Candidatus Saccharimonadales bacterium]